ncbi:MAG: phage terminase large subunit [Proteobacteria bacterium]|nr:phage terminase large subunit [Pseudomonadota bacterium]
MTAAQIELPEKLIPVFEGEADVRGAHGGRGSAKTRNFAKMTAVRAYMWDMAGREGIILCGREFMNSLDDSSLAEVKAAIASEPWLAAHFEVGEKYVRTKSGRIAYKFAGLDQNIDSIKSKARILLCWVDEAEPVSEEAWQTLIPTLREEDSELWVTWNPKSPRSATHKRFRLSKDTRFKIAEMNYTDNPWFPEILDRQRARDQLERPDSYDHIWNGDFARVVEGAYYAAGLTRAQREGRIGFVAADPLLPIRAVADIGGTGQKADLFSFWIVQFVGVEIRWLDHYSAKGQPFAVHVAWLRDRGWSKAQIVLPHDGEKQDTVYDASPEKYFRDADFDVMVVPNQGRGAAKQRIEAGRRLFPSMRFNAATTEAGREALGAYHAHKDDKRGIDLGPEHDWASHDADAFGLGCIFFEGARPRARQKLPFTPRKVA